MSSPKVLPGGYLVRVPPDRVPAGYQPPAAVACDLPDHGGVTARLVLQRYATLPIKVVRKGNSEVLAGVTVALTRGSERLELQTTNTGTVEFTELMTTQPPYGVEIAFAGPGVRAYEPWTPRSLALQSGANAELTIELEALGEIRAKVVDSEATNKLTLRARVTLTPPDDGTEIQAETDDSTGEAVFVGLAPGSYSLAAVTTRTEDDFYTVSPAEDVVVKKGEVKEVSLTAGRCRSLIVMSDKASRQEAKGLFKDLLMAPYSRARDELKKRSIKSSTLLLPFTGLAFDDVVFEPDDGYWDDDRESIAITGWAEAFGARRQILFAHTYRPNRLILALKLKEWKFDRDWMKTLRGPMTQHLNMSNAFVVLSASETEVKSADLPPGVSSFLGQEELDLKQGVNLYGKLDISGFPSLEQLLGWMGVDETYVTIEGYLGHDANFVLSREASENHQPHESSWELALSGTIPWPIRPLWQNLISKRELTLEIGFSQEAKGYPGAVLYNVGSAVRKKATGKDAGKTTKEIEKKIHVKIEDAITIPLPTIAVPWLVVVNEDKDVEFTGAFQVEVDWEAHKKAAKAEAAGSEDAKTGKTEKTEGAEKTEEAEKTDEKKKSKEPEVTLEYGTDLTIALFAKEVAIHDFKAEINLSEDKLKLSGEIDLGRREKVAIVEFERDLPASGTGAKPSAAGTKPSTVESGPSTPPKPGLNLEEKQNKPQPEAPTEEELSKAPKDGATKEKKKSPWTVTVKVKPGIVLGMVDIIKDLGAFLASHKEESS